jgi:hypothetical protein
MMTKVLALLLAGVATALLPPMLALWLCYLGLGLVGVDIAWRWDVRYNRR